MPLLFKPITVILLLVTSLFVTVSSYAAVMEIELAKPTFVLPQFTGPYREREASVAPEEYEMADRLRSLLENNQRQQVLQQLAEFYDIELSPAMLALKAQVYFTLEMYDEALTTYKAVLSRKPELVRVHADLGQLYLIRNDLENARKHFAKAIEFGSNSAIIHGQLGYINLTQYGSFSAIAAYQQAIALEPQNPQWQQGLLAALTQAKMYPAAMAMLEDLLKQHPELPELWLNKAALSLSMGESKEALIAIEMAMLLGEDNSKNIKIAAQLHLQLNSFDRALELITQHINRTKLEMPVLNEYLMWLGQINMWTQADELLDDVAPQLTTMSTADQCLFYAHKARIQQVQNNPKQAEHFYNLALDKNPADGETLLSFADFSAAQKQYVQSELLYVRAEATKETEKQAILGRIQLYINLKDFPSALTQLKRALLKYPELFELKEKIDTIENIVRAQTQLSS
ncbi:tetratricopeptide repeat protein [Alteromonadaceae bacterium BrNp21-10]|nr:tetratricopeptide repeat protein [Alteromonadaceae bacterium BrNp21-10]